MVRPLFFLTLAMTTLTFSSLIGNPITLDEVMSREDQKKTGIANLSLQQKIALETWINKTFVLKNQTQENTAQLSLSINIDEGQKLQLSDNSIWEIAPDDVSKAAVWITPFPVNIAPSNDPNYPSLIINTNSGVSVKAKKISPPPPGQ